MRNQPDCKIPLINIFAIKLQICHFPFPLHNTCIVSTILTTAAVYNITVYKAYMQLWQCLSQSWVWSSIKSHGISMGWYLANRDVMQGTSWIGIWVDNDLNLWMNRSLLVCSPIPSPLLPPPQLPFIQDVWLEEGYVFNSYWLTTHVHLSP